ncbi:unnamed protein product, partial [Brenthis ino]
MAESDISRWLKEDQSDLDDLTVPELPNEDCSDIEDVPKDYIIEGECQSESELEYEGPKPQLSENEKNTLPPMEDSSSDDDITLARHRNYFGKNRFHWSMIKSSSFEIKNYAATNLTLKVFCMEI